MSVEQSTGVDVPLSTYGLIANVAIALFAMLLASFWARRYFGLAPLFMAVGAAEGIKYFVATPLIVELNQGAALSMGSIVFYTANLSIAMLLYVREGAAAVRPMAWCIAAMSISIALLTALMHQPSMVVAGAEAGHGRLFESWRIFVGTTLLILSINASLVLIASLLRRGFGLFAAHLVSLSAVCMLDSFFYSALLEGSLPDFRVDWLPNVVGKILIGTLYTLMVLAYLRYVERFKVRRQFEAVQGRDLFALLTFQDHIRKLEFDLHQDALTNVHNRRYLDSFVAEQVALNARSGLSTSVLMIDVDHFKSVNDEHGHLLGDQVLVHVAHTIRKLIRRGDQLCRYGGEEFVVHLSDTNMADALRLAENIRVHMQNTPITFNNGKSVTATISIGVASSPKDGSQLYQLIDCADRRLYAAKKAGRNRVQGLELTAVA